MAALTHIMYVDDEPDIRAIVEMALQAVGGFAVTLCQDGREALEKAPRVRPDLILLDVMMPGMDGPQTLEALRRAPELAAVPGRLAGEAAALPRPLPGRAQRAPARKGPPRHPRRVARHLGPEPNTPDPEKSLGFMPTGIAPACRRAHIPKGDQPQQDRTRMPTAPRQPSPYERAGLAEINAPVERVAPA